jgi:HK97 family phage portal protein
MQLRGIIRQYLQKRLFGYGPSDDSSYVDAFAGPAKDVKLLGLYSGVAYKCINSISESIADKYKPVLYSLDAKGNKTTIYDHPFLTLLQNPNPDLSFYQLMEGSASFIEQFGEFFWYMVPGSISGYDLNGPKQIYLLRPDKMGIVLDKKTGEVIGYNYQTGVAGGKIPFTPQEIIHQMTFNPNNQYRGYSTTEAAIDYIMTEQEVSRFSRNYFANNAALSGVLNINSKMPRDSWNKLVRQWRERNTGVANAGKVLLVRDSQFTFTPLTSNISDMQLDELKQTTVEQIMMMYGVPKGIFGMESDQGLGRASVETLEYIYAKWTLNNKMGRFDDTLQRAFTRYFPKVPYMFTHENIIPSDKEFELSVFNQGVDRWITREEIRAKDPNLSNNDIDGADQLLALNTMLPVNDLMSSDKVVASRTPPAPAPGPADGGDDTNGDDDDSGDGDGDGEDGKSMKITLTKSTKKKEFTSQAKEEFRLKLQKTLNDYIPKYKQAFNEAIDKQKTTVLGNIQHLASSKGIADNSFDMGDSDQEIAESITPVIQALVKEQGQTSLAFSGSDATYSFTQSLMNAITASTKKMSQNFNAQTLDDLNSTIAEGVAAGEGTEGLASRVESVYSDATGYRADRIARTESSNASNSATLDAYQQNPVITAMEWAADDDPCPFCDELDGTQVGLEESFVSQGDSVDVTDDDGNDSSYQADYGDVNTPPLHPNCECTIIPVIE